MTGLPPKERQTGIPEAIVSFDDTLRLLAQSKAPEGLAQRIEKRLASADVKPLKQARKLWWQRFLTPGYPQVAMASVLLCVAVGATVGAFRWHRAPVLPLPVRMNQGGVGAAGAVRVAPAGVAAPEGTMPRIAPKSAHGRAVIQAGHKTRPKGVAVPNTPPPPDRGSSPEE